MNQLTHLDLFSGIGGFAIAAQAAGYQTLGFCEREPYAQQILKERFGAVLADAQKPRSETRPGDGMGADHEPFRNSELTSRPRLHPDIFDLDGTEYAGIDLLTGGFPCQPFSVAGKRLGAADDRAIWPQMLRVITESAPTWIIGENVAGIVTMELDNILSDLEAIGYSAWPLVIPACAVDAKHRRDRVWIIAHANSGRCQQRDEGERSVSEPDANGQDVADANSQRGRLWEVHRQDEGNAGESSSTGQGRGVRLTQPAVRGVAHGLPQGLDRNDQFCQWQDEDSDTPRVTTGIKHRAHRLKGLGNAIVPQVAFEIIQAIRNCS